MLASAVANSATACRNCWSSSGVSISASNSPLSVSALSRAANVTAAPVMSGRQVELLQERGVSKESRPNSTLKYHLIEFYQTTKRPRSDPVTYYVLFFIHLESRRICVSGITRHPDPEWMEQQARAVTLQEWGFLAKHKYRLQDRDAKFCTSFRQLIETDGRKTIVLPARSPNLHAYAERWVRSVKEECRSRLILFGERSLRRALQQYGAHYHEERNHQGRQNLLLFPRPSAGACKAEGTVRCWERLGGLLKYYDRQAA